MDRPHGSGRALIVAALRSPLGRRNGGLSGWHPVDLAAACLTALGERPPPAATDRPMASGPATASDRAVGFDPALVDDVVFACVSQIGAQSTNVARSVVLAAGWPETVGAATLEAQDVSGERALHLAVHAVMAGAADVTVAGGVEVPSLVPAAAAMGRAYGAPFGPAVARRFAARGGLLPPGLVAEATARRHGLSRAELDAYAFASRERATRAAAAGRFDAEVVPLPERHRDPFGEGTGTTGTVPVPTPGASGTARLLRADEGAVAATADELAALRPLFDPDGVVTAGNSAPAADGAALCLVASEGAAERLGGRPLAAVVSTAAVGGDPLLSDSGVAAARRALQLGGLALGDVDLVEVHESSAAAVLAWLEETGAEGARVNVNGGAIALGHPAGTGGVRQVVTLVHELGRRGARYGLSVTGAAGGVGTATLLERLG